MSIRFDCPTCKQPCEDLRFAPALVQTKSDPHLIAPDQKQQGLALTALCRTCLSRHAVVLPVMVMQTQKLQMAEETTPITKEEAGKAGLELVRN